ncbi:substrate-binding domain-containing protein [bacterium]|nr:substrate-binding domain-containing protein [candidate division CSSED10-310 bacterium]
MKKLTVFSICLLAGIFLAIGAETSAAETNKHVITLATTTSTENSGLLAYLHPEFTRDTGIDVKVIPRGTGAALKLAEQGDCDVVMVHALAMEEAFVAAGFGTERYALMHNDFVLLGHPSDPAGARGKPITQALTAIHSSAAPFISRGDASGTHAKEIELWKKAGIEPGAYCLSIGQGMGKALMMAAEKKAYTLSDRGTWIAMKDTLDLVLISEGGAELANPYSVIPVNPAKHPHVKYDIVMKYIHWLRSERGQNLINGFRKDGEQLFLGDVSGTLPGSSGKLPGVPETTGRAMGSSPKAPAAGDTGGTTK